MTVAVTDAKGEDNAVTFLYPHVRERAKLEFDILGRAADSMSKKDTRFTPLVDMVRQASEMSLKETDMGLAAAQAFICRDDYLTAAIFNPPTQRLWRESTKHH